MKAYILISCGKGKENDIFEKLSDEPEVIGSHMIFGEWDIMLKVDVESPEELGTFVVDKIRPLDGVNLSSTLIVAR